MTTQNDGAAAAANGATGATGAGQPPDGGQTLDGLAAAIRDGHRKCLHAMKGVVEQARDTGTALNAAKGMVPHGGWTSWVKTKCKVGVRMAQNYMLVATHYDAIVARCARTDAWRLTEFLKVAQQLKREARGKPPGAAGRPGPFALPPDEIARRRERLRAAAGADRLAAEAAVAAFLRQRLDALYAAVRQFAASKGLKDVAGDGLDAADVGILLVESLKAGLDPAGLALAAEVALSPQASGPAAPECYEGNGRHPGPLLV